VNGVKPLVVVIEDDPTSAEALTLILSDWGAEVVSGDDAETLADALAPRAASIGWIITDFHLGEGPDGVVGVQRLRAAAPQARVLVLSGSFHGRATEVAAEHGLPVMHKPARADAIVAWLEAK
jgi:ActR/RegA family two-component response regulator